MLKKRRSRDRPIFDTRESTYLGKMVFILKRAPDRHSSQYIILYLSGLLLAHDRDWEILTSSGIC